MRQLPMTIANAILELSTNKIDVITMCHDEAVSVYDDWLIEPRQTNYHFKDNSVISINENQAWSDSSSKRIIFIKS